MYLRAKDYCGGRTRDGRVFVIMAGTTTVIDDNDRDMVELVNAWISQGVAEVPDTDDAEAEVGPPQRTDETPAPPVKKAAATKAATTSRASTKEAGK